MIKLIGMVFALLAGTVSATEPTGSWLDDLGPAARQSLAGWEVEATQVYDDHAQRLAARGDSRSLLAASDLATGVPLEAARHDSQQRARRDKQATIWLNRALETEPVEPMALWRAANRCRGDQPQAGCDYGNLLRRLTLRDPDNAMVWLALAIETQRTGDHAPANEHMARAASAPRYDAYDLAYGRLLLDAHAGLELPPLAPELVAALLGLNADIKPDDGTTEPDILDVAMMGRWATHAFPVFTDLTTICPVQEPAQMAPVAREQCRALLSTMIGSATSLITIQVGLSCMARLSRDDSDGAQWLEQLRQFEWRKQRFAELLETSGGREPVDGHLRRVLGEGELAALEHALATTGNAMEAPPGWLPEWGVARELSLARQDD